MYEPGLHEIVRAARDGNDLVHDSSLDSSRAAHGKGGFINGAKSNVDCIRQPNLFFSTDIDRAIDDADLIFVCVNTPTKRNGIGKGTAVDLGFVETATRNIARAARGSKIVVEKSTVPCRTAHSIREIVSFHQCIDFNCYDMNNILIIVPSFLPMLGPAYTLTFCLILNFLPRGLQSKIYFIQIESLLDRCLRRQVSEQRHP